MKKENKESFNKLNILININLNLNYLWILQEL
jgi:hypothetical protein